MLLAHRLSPVFTGDPFGAEPLRAAVIYASSFVLLAYTLGLYDWDVLARSRMTLVLRGLLCAAVAAGITVVGFYFVYYRPVGRWVVALAVALTVPLVLGPHFYVLVKLQHRRRRVLFVGRSPLTDRMVRGLRARLPPALPGGGTLDAGRCCSPGNGDDLVELARSRGVDEIVLPASLSNVQAALLPALRCLPLGCRVRSEADFHEDMFRAVPVEEVSPEWMLGRGWDASDHLTGAVKRLGDVALAFALLVLTGPLQLLLALIVKASGGGPAFFRQTRVGQLRPHLPHAEAAHHARGRGDGRARMGPGRRPAADARGPRPAAHAPGRAAPDPQHPDGRHVLRGPAARAAGVRGHAREARHPLLRLAARRAPGPLGLGADQLPLRRRAWRTRVRKLEYDLYYIRHFSLATDLFIVLRTLSAAAMRGAR